MKSYQCHPKRANSIEKQVKQMLNKEGKHGYLTNI